MVCIQLNFKIPELCPAFVLGQQSSKSIEFKFLFGDRS